MKCISRCSPFNIAVLESISLISSLKKAAGSFIEKTFDYTDTDRVERWYPLEKAQQTPLFLITLRLYT